MALHPNYPEIPFELELMLIHVFNKSINDAIDNYTNTPILRSVYKTCKICPYYQYLQTPVQIFSKRAALSC